jgi:G3E family GTPase
MMAAAGMAGDSGIPLTVIGGFLGAGKTTLLNRLLRQSTRRYTVLVNDFGAVNIDAALVASHDGSTINLANGCVCCTMADGLSEALLRVLEAPVGPEHIVIEASGVGDPWQIAGIALAEPDLRLAAVIVLADAEQLSMQLADRYIGDTVRRQIMRADILVLNKVDLVEARQLDVARSLLRDLRPALRIVETAQAAMPADLLDADLPSRADLQLPAVQDHGIRRWLYRNRRVFARRALEALLDDLPPSLLRLKGWCRIAGAPQPLLLQMSGARWTLSSAVAPPALLTDETLLVALGTAALPDDARLTALFDAACAANAIDVAVA